MPVSSILVKDSLINPECKYIVYFDETIFCVYIDSDEAKSNKIKCIEIISDGVVSGIKRNEGNWTTYTILEGLDERKCSNPEIKNLYNQIKHILIKVQDENLLPANNPISDIDKETDKIYFEICHKCA